ncbi:M28 family metallopeptidase [Pseudomarimonas arenosa]|uniref:M28 family peptidase n=1 Tax=Pseudomarimonas arenosa TaxID=2774145 RepID=A0AAW3ZGJ5_9GAMM|nr:M28 family metallopeptidase [Pseudomarimonas arenosa]MBD8524277.1 M28 family peptidase [Pseudomarimonas arenosa]
MALAFLAPGQVLAGDYCRTVAISNTGFNSLEAKQKAAGVRWLELGHEWLVCGEPDPVEHVTADLQVLREIEDEFNDLVLIQGFRRQAHPASEVLASGGRFAVLTRSDAERVLRESEHTHGHSHSQTLDIPWNTVLVRMAENRPPRAKRAASPQIDAMVAAVNGSRWLGDVATLASHDRHSLRTGIAGARDWIQAQFEAMPGISAQLDPFQVSGVTVHNVIATLPGSTRADEIYIVGGHYDAIGGSFSPGAEDNASGCAGVLELARIFAANPPPPTMLFVCYAGEEQGLLGSHHQVADLRAAGDDARVVHMLNMDMIGFSGDADLDCLLETEDAFAGLLDVYADAALDHTTLSIATSLHAFGSDHVPFIGAGMPALLTIENDWDSYPHYHRSSDIAANVSLQMGVQILRMNVAALAGMMGIEGGPVFSNGFEQLQP